MAVHPALHVLPRTPQFEECYKRFQKGDYNVHEDIQEGTPQVQVGDSSCWQETPHPIREMQWMFEGNTIDKLPIIDDTLIGQIVGWYDQIEESEYHYNLTPLDKVKDFLNLHKGERLFLVIW